MGKTFEITRQMLDDIERYREEIILLADRRIETLQYDLAREEEWRAWCVKAAPILIYSRQQEKIASEADAIKDAERKEIEYQSRVRIKKYDRFLIACLIALAMVVLLGLEWYQSTSYGNFCYRLGSHIVSILFGSVILAAGIGISLWFKRKRGR